MNAALLAGGRLAALRLDVVSTAGLAGLYDLTRVNMLSYSEGPLASHPTRGGAPAVASLPASESFAEWFGYVGGATASQYNYTPMAVSPVVGQMYTASAYVRMDDGGVPIMGAQSPANSFALILFGSAPTINPGMTHLGGGLYRVWGAREYPAAGQLPNNNGVLKYTNNDARGFKATGYMVNLGAVPLPYEKTGDPQVVYDSGVKGLNLIPAPEDFLAASWIKNVSGAGIVPVVTANAEPAPDGTMTAARGVFDLGGGTTSADISQLSATGTIPAGDYTSTVWLRTTDGTTKNVVVAAPTGNGQTFAVTPTWQRFTVNVTSIATTFTIKIRLRGGATDNTSGQASLAIWHPMTNAGATALPYERNPAPGTLGANASADATDPLITPAGLVFDGVDDRVMVTPPPYTGAMTLNVVFAASGPPSGGYHGLVGGATGAGFYPRLLWNGSSLILVQWMTGNSHGPAIPAPALGVFGMYTATYDGVTSRIYYNGQLVGTQVISAPLASGVGQMSFGTGALNSNTYFANGVMPHARVYTRALADREVVGMYRTLKKSLAARGVTLS